MIKRTEKKRFKFFKDEVRTMIKYLGFKYKPSVANMGGKVFSEVMEDLGWKRTAKDWDSLEVLHLMWFSKMAVVYDDEAALYKKVKCLNKIRNIDQLLSMETLRTQVSELQATLTNSVTGAHKIENFFLESYEIPEHVTLFQKVLQLEF